MYYLYQNIGRTHAGVKMRLKNKVYLFLCCFSECGNIDGE